ncbi:cytochrome P450 [Trametes maxima]|nr:cytochrome P450 [Trametes maxima]
MSRAIDLSAIDPASVPLPFVLLGVGLLALYIRYRQTAKASSFPPGPPAKPVVGNILDVSPEGAWEKFTEYKDTYGDLVFFHGLGNHILVLNSLKVINDLFEKRASIYSDRPSFTVVGELMGLGQSMPLLPYDDDWRAQRKLAHAALSPSAVKQYHLIQEDLAALLSEALLDRPNDLHDHMRLTASRLILSITYGLSVNTADSEYISHAEDTMHMISKATVPGAFLCDLIPPLKYLPSWMPFHKAARKGYDMIDRLVTKPFERVQQEMKSGIAPPSLTRDLLSLDNADTSTLLHQIKWATGSLYGAGGETTYSTVLVFVMAMALHPDKLRKAQEEIDRVVGTERMPLISDRPDLPYVDALIKETMRWHPTLPLSIARSTAAEDVYEGYRIPKGTIVMPNVWAIAFEPKGPYDPHEFVPERFLVPNEEDRPIDPVVWAFGFARRLCPGKYLAENSVFVLIATVIAMFDIAKPDNGDLKINFTKGLVSYPEQFDCKITVRSPSKLSQIRYRVGQCVV